ncbi:hypothetical protein CBM2634_B160446 [Cupriavidus taiwanensis]|uniref:Uncharacterized protein n=1 Tax=Cupriavidus taiwanensis TaxID=164546 RepID=A0A375J8W8_9BURK|nr:hypothetical protein CBM2634_B160446 [Cupriavidus taiwanensis]
MRTGADRKRCAGVCPGAKKGGKAGRGPKIWPRSRVRCASA